MKMKKLVAISAMMSGLAGFAVPAAHAEVGASIGAANMYYWRGLDLGGGAQVWGDLKYSESGFYTGIWGGSGDKTNGQEYDIYAGYGGAVGDFKYDFSLWTYSYPSVPVADDEAPGSANLDPGDLSEAVLMLGYGPVAATYYKNISAKGGLDNSYSYATIAATFDKFTVKYGVHMDDTDTSDGIAHLDLTYAFNDKVSFTIGSIVDDKDKTVASGSKFVVAFSLPIQ